MLDHTLKNSVQFKKFIEALADTDSELVIENFKHFHELIPLLNVDVSTISSPSAINSSALFEDVSLLREPENSENNFLQLIYGFFENELDLEDNKIFDQIIQLNKIFEENQPKSALLRKSYFQAIKDILKVSGPMALSFTISFTIVAIALMAARLDDHYEKEKLQAAIDLITISTDSLFIIAASSFFAISISGSQLFGKISKAQQLKELLNSADADLQSKPIQNYLKTLRSEFARILPAGVLWSLVVLPLPMIAMLKAEPILIILKQNSIVAKYVGEFLNIYAWSLPGLTLRMIVEQLTFAIGQSKPSTAAALFSFISSGLVAGYLTFGAPNLGLRGLATGFAIEPYLTALLLLPYLATSKNFEHIRFFRDFFTNNIGKLFASFKSLAKIGAPITLQLLAEISAFIAINIVAGDIGTDSQAAQNFVTQLFFLAVFPRVAIGQTTTIFVGQSVGANAYDLVKRYAYSGLALNISFAALLGIPPAIYPNCLSFLITNGTISPDIEALVRKLMPIAATMIVVDSVKYNVINTLRPMGSLLKPTLIAAFLLIFFTALGGYLGLETSWGSIGLNLMFALGLFLGAAANTFLWSKKSSEISSPRIEVIEPDSNEENYDNVISINDEKGYCSSVADCWASMFSCKKTEDTTASRGLSAEPSIGSSKRLSWC